MAMTVQQDFLGPSCWLICRHMTLKELAEQECLGPKFGGTLILRKQVVQLIAKHRGTTRFKNDEGHPSVDLSGEHVKDARQVLLRGCDHPEVVERAPAAVVASGYQDSDAALSKNRKCRTRDLWMEVVGERVNPQHSCCRFGRRIDPDLDRKST